MIALPSCADSTSSCVLGSPSDSSILTSGSLSSIASASLSTSTGLFSGMVSDFSSLCTISFIFSSMSNFSASGSGASCISSPGTGVTPPPLRRPPRLCGRQPAGPPFSFTQRRNSTVLPVLTELEFFRCAGQSLLDVGPITSPSSLNSGPPESPRVAES